MMPRRGSRPGAHTPSPEIQRTDSRTRRCGRPRRRGPVSGGWWVVGGRGRGLGLGRVHVWHYQTTPGLGGGGRGRHRDTHDYELDGVQYVSIAGGPTGRPRNTLVAFNSSSNTISSVRARWRAIRVDRGGTHREASDVDVSPRRGGGEPVACRVATDRTLLAETSQGRDSSLVNTRSFRAPPTRRGVRNRWTSA